MPTSQEDLAKKAEEVQKLRDRVSSEKDKVDAVAREANNDIAMSQLRAEEAELEAELARLKQESTKKHVRESAAPIIDANKTTEKAADAQASAIDKAADKSAASEEK